MKVAMPSLLLSGIITASVAIASHASNLAPVTSPRAHGVHVFLATTPDGCAGYINRQTSNLRSGMQIDIICPKKSEHIAAPISRGRSTF